MIIMIYIYIYIYIHNGILNYYMNLYDLVSIYAYMYNMSIYYI